MDEGKFVYSLTPQTHATTPTLKTRIYFLQQISYIYKTLLRIYAYIWSYMVQQYQLDIAMHITHSK